MKNYVWPIKVYAKTTNSAGQARTIDCYMEGAGDTIDALVRAVNRRRDFYIWYGVDIHGITPLGQKISIIYGPDITEVMAN